MPLMAIQGMLHPFNHGLKNLMAISALKSVVALHFRQFVKAGSVADRENVFGH